MRLTSLIPAFLAATLVSASPDIDEGFLDDLADGDVHVFRRDDVITPRDIELAERDNVDLGQMYRHSMIKRDDGDHITIWVDNSFIEHDDEEDSETDDSSVDLTKRQSYRIGTNQWNSNRRNKECFNTKYVGDTGPHAPFTGGANAIINWGNSNCKGSWFLIQQRNNLIVAGSNSGFNLRFTAELTSSLGHGVVGYIGCRDVGSITHTARDRYQQNHGGWRVRARGQTQCNVVGTACYKTQCQPSFGSRIVNWWIDNYDGRI